MDTDFVSESGLSTGTSELGGGGLLGGRGKGGGAGKERGEDNSLHGNIDGQILEVGKSVSSVKDTVSRQGFVRTQEGEESWREKHTSTDLFTAT